MHFVYVLQSEKDDKFYIGCTTNLEQRLKTHNQGLVQSTRSRGPFKIIFHESYDNKYEAFRMERFYKSAIGKRQLKKKIYSGIV